MVEVPVAGADVKLHPGREKGEARSVREGWEMKGSKNERGRERGREGGLEWKGRAEGRRKRKEMRKELGEERIERVRELEEREREGEDRKVNNGKGRACR